MKFLIKTLCLIVPCVVIFSGCGNQYGNSESNISSNTDSNNTTSNVYVAPEQDLYNGLFSANKVVNIDVTINQEDFEKILANPTDDTYYSTTVAIDGASFDNVGMSTKGHLSLTSVANSDSDRYSFKFKFDEFVKNQTYYGLDCFCINNSYSDPSFLREYISYELLNTIGDYAPKCSFSKLNINGQYYGFYINVEKTKESFIQRVFNTTDSLNHYEAEKGSSLASYDSLKNINLLSGEDENLDELKKLVDALQNLNQDNYKDIESILDVDSVLQYIAGNVLTGNYDSYLSSMAQNYEFVQYNGKLYMIPWDFNMAFGAFSGDQGKSLNINIDAPCLNSSSDKLPLLKLLNYPEYKEKYYAYLRKGVDYLNNIESKVTQLADLIRSYVYEDPNKFYTNEDFEAEFVYSSSSSDIQSTVPESNLTENDGNTFTDTNTNNNIPNPPDFPNNQGMDRPQGGGMHGLRNNGSFDKPRVSLMTYALDILTHVKSVIN